jgi:uncharacterized membrane protein
MTEIWSLCDIVAYSGNSSIIAFSGYLLYSVICI